MLYQIVSNKDTQGVYAPLLFGLMQWKVGLFLVEFNANFGSSWKLYDSSVYQSVA